MSILPPALCTPPSIEDWGRRVWGPGPLGLGAEGLGEEDWGPRELCLLVAVGESSVTLLQVPRLRSACLCPPWWR